MKRVLLFGCTGQVGWELHRSLQPLGEIFAPTRIEADFSEPAALRGLIREYQPHLIVNAAAYTDVDKAESEESLAHCVNARAPSVMAEEAVRLGALVVHYSSDYVFDGTNAQPYTEEDESNPMSVYGSSKIAGDRAIQASGCYHLIFRTSWVYSLRRNNFVLKILSLVAKQGELRIVNDKFGTPTSARLIADVTACCLYRLASEPQAHSTLRGIFNLAAGGATSRFGFARAIIDEIQAIDMVFGKGNSLMPIQSEVLSTRMLRPKNSQLNCDRIKAAFDVTLPEWQLDLRLTLAELFKPRTPQSDR